MSGSSNDNCWLMSFNWENRNLISSTLRPMHMGWEEGGLDRVTGAEEGRLMVAVTYLVTGRGVHLSSLPQRYGCPTVVRSLQ